MADPTKTAGSKKIKSAPFKIAGKPVVSERFIKMMVYGEPGSGKSTLFASAVDVPHMNDVLYIDAEKGEMVLDENDRIKNADNIDRVRVSDFRTVASIQEFLKAHCIARDNNDEDKLRTLEAMAKGVEPSEIVKPRRYRTVIVDSLSEVNEFCMYQLLNLSTDMHLDLDDMDVAEWGEFRKSNQMMQLLTRAYRDLAMNVLFIASAQYSQDELKRKAFTPNMTGKLAGQVQGFMDVVGYLQTGKVPEGQAEAPRRLWVQPVGNFNAKNRRSVWKQAYFDNPVMQDIMEGFALT